MQSQGLLGSFVALASMASSASAAATTDSSPPTLATPCAAKSTIGAFFDLRPDTALGPPGDGVKLPKGAPTQDYFAKGHDYGSNFTLNICAPVVNPPAEVVGLTSTETKHVSAYYQSGDKFYSIGQNASLLVPRGRKLVLLYTEGSPCGESTTKAKRGSAHQSAQYKKTKDDYDEDGLDLARASATGKQAASTSGADAKMYALDHGAGRRKSTTISFLCDRDAITPTAASFVGVDPDECAYFFEVRSSHACAVAEPHKAGSVGPGSVFAIIFFIAIMVYLMGGIMYQRNVAHARGWRQLPNYTMWFGICNFLKDVVVVTTSSCVRFLICRRGYHSSSHSSVRNCDRESENRLIDQLDEEWDD